MFDNSVKNLKSRPERLKVSLGAMLIALGFSSIAIYFGLTIFYPLLQFDQFVGFGMREGIEGIRQLLLGKYLGHLSLLIFGIVSTLAGQLIRSTKREIDNHMLAAVSISILTAFAILVFETLI